MSAPHLVRSQRAVPVVLRESTTITALLVWTYQRQKADVMSGKGLWMSEQKAASPDAEPPQAWSGCGCAQLAVVAALGARIESGGWQRPAVHNDADLVHDLVIEMSKGDWIGAMLLQRYGRQGGAPEWSEGRQEFEPERDGRDRIVQDRYHEVAVTTDAAGRVRAVPVRFCPVRPYPSDDWIEMTRGEYRSWHRALSRLADMLARPPKGRDLQRWTIIGLGAAAEPWSACATEPENEIR
jgi:hypothetical protein